MGEPVEDGEPGRLEIGVTTRAYQENEPGDILSRVLVQILYRPVLIFKFETGTFCCLDNQTRSLSSVFRETRVLVVVVVVVVVKWFSRPG